MFNAVCLREPENFDDRERVRTMTDSLVSNDYRLKQVFAESAAYCTQDL